MTFTVKHVQDAGTDKERVVLQVGADMEIGKYILFVAKMNNEKQTISGGKQGAVYWIPDEEVKKGDIVVIYTKSGKSRTKINPNGSTSYFYYWGLEQSVFGDDESFAPVIGIFSGWNRIQNVSYTIDE